MGPDGLGGPKMGRCGMSCDMICRENTHFQKGKKLKLGLVPKVKIEELYS